MLRRSRSSIRGVDIDLILVEAQFNVIHHSRAVRREVTQSRGVIHESKWLNGAGAGLSVTHTSGHVACVPCVSLLTSKPIVPVRPAKSNGCLGYIAKTVTVPAD